MQGSTPQFEMPSHSHRSSPQLQLLSYWRHPGLLKMTPKRLYGHNNSRKTRSLNKSPIRLQKLREREKEETEKAKREEQKERDRKKPKLNPFTPNKPVASYITHRPSRFAMQKLQDREYIELSYFTPEGREEAANHDHTVAEEAFALSKVNDYVGLRPIAAFKALKSVIPDDKLTWIQMTRAKTNLLNCMEETGWPNEYSNALATFFLSIENHPHLQRAGGERVMLAYQAQVRRDWHRALKDPTGNHAFDISIINEDLLNAMSTKITEDTHQQLTARSVSLINI